MATKALKIYDTLDEEQKLFIREKKIEKNYKPKRWLELFDKISEMDKFSDEFRKKSLIYMIILGFIMFLTFIFAMESFIALMIFLIPLSTFVVLYLLFKKHKLIDIENHFRLTLVPLLSILKEEMDVDDKLYLSIDCSNQESKEKITKIIEPSSKNMPYFTTTYFKNPWLYMEGKFRDGTLISLNFEDTIRKKDITKRSSRGKVKTKSKYKIVHKIKISLQFPKDRYQLKEPHKNPKERENYYEYVGIEKCVSNSPEIGMDLQFPLTGIARGYSTVRRNENQ